MNSKLTRCPKCHHDFEIHKNRLFKIREKTQIVWFADAMNQFENFSEVTCPNCKENYKAPEARLFGIFKSSYTVIWLAIAFNAAWMLLLYLIGTN